MFRTIRPNIRQTSRCFHSLRTPIPKFKPFYKPITIIVSCSITIYTFHSYNLIANDAKFDPTRTLKPDPKGDTYENSLYLASQEELVQDEQNYRDSRLSTKLGWIYYIRFKLNDYIWEPLVTIGRFFELTIIFLPILITLPITIFGKTRNNTSSGSLIWYKIIRISLENAGASFIKLGQWAASRTDIFNDELCKELGNLHSNAKQHSLSYTRKILEESFGGLKFEEIFEEFNEKPIGVGAIAQVYLGTLSKNLIDNIDGFQPIQKSKKSFFNSLISNDDIDLTNKKVAIKVIHPNATIKIKRDLKIMKFFANFIDNIPTMEWLSLPDEVRNFDVLMNLQLDLRIEGLNLLRFQENYKDDYLINFPTPFLKFSNRLILVEEFINGVSMSKFLDLKQRDLLNNDVSKKISDSIIDSFLQMLILKNFIHSDLHAGNIIIRFIKTKDDVNFTNQERDQVSEKLNNSKDTNTLSDEINNLNSQGYEPEICYIDAGLITELNEKNRVNFIALFNSLAEFDGYKAGELMIERSKTPETAIDSDLFALKVERLVDKIKQRTFTLGTVSIGDLLEKMLSMVRSHHVRMEGDFVSVIVAILLLEGIGRQLDPNLDLFARFVYFALINGIPDY